MRIVLDTNVVISALLWRGTPYSLLQIIRQRAEIRLFSSDMLLEELSRVLLRPGPGKRLAAIGRTAGELLADYVEAVDIVTPLNASRVVADDPDDDQVIAAAVAADADIIASGDRHLLDLRAYRDIRILSPGDTLAFITAMT